jgi:hypothetical protein
MTLHHRRLMTARKVMLTHACTSPHTHTFLLARVQPCIHRHRHIHTRTYTHRRAQTHKDTLTHAYIYTLTHTQTHTHTHTDTHTHTHTHAHTHTQARPSAMGPTSRQIALYALTAQLHFHTAY